MANSKTGGGGWKAVKSEYLSFWNVIDWSNGDQTSSCFLYPSQRNKEIIGISCLDRFYFLKKLMYENVGF